MAGLAGDEPFTAVLERMNRFQEAEGRRIIADLALPAGSRGLDVGCGVGLYTLWLAEAAGADAQVIGIEPTAERVEHARALCGPRLGPPRLAFQQGDGTALPWPAATFDWVWCGDALHHILETERALREFLRVLRPGGRLVVKESQAVPALFLPGHPDLERAIQQAEVRRSLAESGDRSFQERRQRTAESLHAVGARAVGIRTYVLERRAPLAAVDRAYVERVIFERNWGSRLREFLAPEDWRRRSALCEPASPDFILARPDYYCVYPITVFTGEAGSSQTAGVSSRP
jgi:demethylmenaquinone methyltransferase/2-methoxy-6-polyprenyl-1,4-benzoquinol methylase